jgi:GNAT superfamily N-acetyltransferase
VLGGFEELGRRHPAFSHWYLAFIGIDPRWQRHGFGRALLEPVLARADAAGVACYLETPFPDTRRFYERFGFHESDQLRPVDDAPQIWTMTRPSNS